MVSHDISTTDPVKFLNRLAHFLDGGHATISYVLFATDIDRERREGRRERENNTIPLTICVLS